MGFEWTCVISDEKHCGTFVCTICQNLVGLDAVVTSTCSHVFCRLCLETWLRKRVERHGGIVSEAKCQCPTCNQDLLQSSNGKQATTSMTVGEDTVVAVHVLPLSEAQPLAHRVLRQVQVRCPLSKVACPWKGDYGDLHAHLLSPTAHEGLAACAAAAVTNATKHSKTPRQGQENNLDGNPSDAIRPLESPLVQRNTAHDDDGDDGEDDDNRSVQDVTPLDNNGEEPQQQNEDDKERRRELAESFKTQADAMFASANYREARDLYTQALHVLEAEQKTAGLFTDLFIKVWSNRAATQLQLKEYDKVVEDCNRCLELDSSHPKAFLRRSKALLALGRFEQAYTTLLSSNNNHNHKESTTETTTPHPDLERQLSHVSVLRNDWNRAWQAYHNGQYAAAKSLLGQHLLRESPLAPSVLLATAQCDLGLGLTESALRWSLQVLRAQPQNATAHRLGLTESALRWSLQVLRAQPQNATAHRLRGHAQLLMGDFSAASTLLREALRLDPDDNDNDSNTVPAVGSEDKDQLSAKTLRKQCRMIQTTMKKARDAVFHRRFGEAVQCYSSLLTTTTTASPADEDSLPPLLLPPASLLSVMIYTERAEAHLRLKQWDKALKDASCAVYAREDYIPAWLVKARAYHGLERFAQARDEMEDLLRKGWGGTGTGEAMAIRKAYESADFEVRKRQRPDFYKLLGLTSSSSLASVMEIKKQYKVKALEYHPDKWSGPQFTDLQRKEAESKFQLLGQALEILTHDFMRQLYDEGYDPEAIRERVAAAQQAAHRSQGHSHGRYS